MPISKENSLARLAEYNDAYNFTPNGSSHKLRHALAIGICCGKWAVSLDSAERYIRKGKQDQARLDEYAEELDEKLDEKLEERVEGVIEINGAEEFKDMSDAVRELSGIIEDEEFEPSPFPILVIPDTHIPFEHPNALQFCKDIAEEYEIATVVHLGDEIDHHALSFHTNELDAMTALQEYRSAKDKIQDWFEAFPDVKLCIGNHSKIPVRRAKEMGLPNSYLRSFHELWNAPDGWDVDHSFTIGGVIFKHAGKAGFQGSINSAIINRASSVFGHNHSHGGILYQANEDNLIFGMNAGCLIDNDAYAFAYGKDFAHKPTLGCGVVWGPTCAEFIPMTGKYFRSGGE